MRIPLGTDTKTSESQPAAGVNEYEHKRKISSAGKGRIGFPFSENSGGQPDPAY